MEEVGISGTSVLFAGDNVDHNIITIDGKGTFHGMGMIAALTPGRKRSHLVTRQKISDLSIVQASKIPVKEYRFSTHALRNVKFKELPAQLGFDMKIDIWELSLHFKQTVPGWQGMMHILHQGQTHPGVYSVLYLPMIDMYPGDKSCILSTLEFLSDLAVRYHFPPVVTFDQPLYWKASEIIQTAPDNSHLKGIVLRPGIFHAFMNLLGAIGTLMAGTGL